MCGRFVSVSSPQLLADRFGIDETVLPGAKLPDHEADYNVTPRAQVMVVRERPPREEGDDVTRVLSLVRWGLVPSWAKDLSMGDRMINACRVGGEQACVPQGVHEAALHRAGRRLLRVEGRERPEREHGASVGKRAPRQPYCVRRRDGEPLAFAGLWEIWRNAEIEDPDAPDAWVRSCTIITTRANGVLAPIHDRMPVVLDESTWDEWLDPTNHDLDALGALLEPAPDDWVEAYPVSTRVNSPKNNDAELVAPAEPETLL
ncbi:MAG: SOS response-associated peptidase [Acidimicrobiia bacterium]